MPISKTQHTTIGIMITEDDRDIAAWFNMMRGYNASKWIAGMLAAWKMGKSLDAGSCTITTKPLAAPAPHPSGLLFGSGQASVATPKYHYGWTVKGPAGEYIVGSVINVSIARKEIQPIVQELRDNKVLLAPFVKALIRSNMKVETVNRQPDISALNQIFMEYRLSNVERQGKSICQTAKASGEESASPSSLLPSTVQPPVVPKLTRHI